MKHLLIPMVLLSFVVIGCGGGASEPQPIADCQAEAKSMDTAKLESTVASYKAAIESKATEMAALKEKLPGIADAIKGAVGGDVPKVDVEGITKDIDALNTAIKNLTQRMGIYATEATQKAKDAAKTAGAACAPSGG